MTTKTITIEKEFGDKTFSKSGPAVVVEKDEDVLTLLSEDASNPVASDASDVEKARIRNRTIKAINYAFDLWARAKLTQALNSEHVDPAKSLDKAIEQFMKHRAALGKPVTRERAVAMLSVE